MKNIGGGTQLKYYTLERDDEVRYYRAKGQWVSGLHDAAHLTEELATRLQKRYPGTVVSQNFGYDIHFRTNLADVGELEPEVAIKRAVRLAKRNGWSWETLAVQVEKAFRADGNVKAV